jgi:hypothetical protein
MNSQTGQSGPTRPSPSEVVADQGAPRSRGGASAAPAGWVGAHQGKARLRAHRSTVEALADGTRGPSKCSSSRDRFADGCVVDRFLIVLVVGALSAGRSVRTSSWREPSQLRAPGMTAASDPSETLPSGISHISSQVISAANAGRLGGLRSPQRRGRCPGSGPRRGDNRIPRGPRGSATRSRSPVSRCPLPDQTAIGIPFEIRRFGFPKCP